MWTSQRDSISCTLHLLMMVMLVAGCLLFWPKTVLAFSDSGAQQALEAAMQYVNLEYEFEGEPGQGVAYLYGGQDTVTSYLKKIAQGAEPGRQAGIDASGLVINAYREVHPQLTFVHRGNSQETEVKDATSSTLYLWNVEPLTPEELRPGDLVFFGTEGTGINGVALYAGRQGELMQIVTASQSQRKVVMTRIRVGGDYWKRSYAGAGRLIKR